MALNLPGVPFKLTPEDMGGVDWAKSLSKGLQLGYQPRMLYEEARNRNLVNAINKPKAENADQWYKAQLNHLMAQTGLLGSQAKEAEFYSQHPLLKVGGLAGQIGAEQFLNEQGNGSQGGWHDTGHGAGWDNGPSIPNQGSVYGESEASTHPGSGQSSGPAPDLDKVVSSLPEERRKALQMTLTSAAGQQRPSYAQRLHDSINAELDKTKTLNKYRQSLIDTANKRASGGLTKDVLDLSDVSEGFMPGTNRQVSIDPEMQQQLKDQYELKIQKTVTDTDTRKKALYASNIDKTIKSIDKNALTKFAGIDGFAKLQADRVKAATNPGSESKEYRAYKVAENKAKLLNKQVRQFYGDSIQPEVTKQLSLLTNPATWDSNPELAVKLFDSFTNLLKQETETYRGALRNTKEFRGQGSNQPIKMTWDANGNLVRAE